MKPQKSNNVVQETERPDCAKCGHFEASHDRRGCFTCARERDLGGYCDGYEPMQEGCDVQR